MKKSWLLLLVSMLTMGEMVQLEAAVIRLQGEGRGIVIPDREPLEVIITESNGHVYRDIAYYNPYIGGIELNTNWAGPNASIYIPALRISFIWYNGYWVDESGYYWNGSQRVYLNNPNWNHYWGGYWQRHWHDQDFDRTHHDGDWHGRRWDREQRRDWQRRRERDHWQHGDHLDRGWRNQWQQRDNWNDGQRSNWQSSGDNLGRGWRNQWQQRDNWNDGQRSNWQSGDDLSRGWRNQWQQRDNWNDGQRSNWQSGDDLSRGWRNQWQQRDNWNDGQRSNWQSSDNLGTGWKRHGNFDERGSGETILPHSDSISPKGTVRSTPDSSSSALHSAGSNSTSG